MWTLRTSAFAVLWAAVSAAAWPGPCAEGPMEDLDSAFRAGLRREVGAIPTGALESDRLLGLAERIAGEIYGPAGEDRAAAARSEIASLPPLPAGLTERFAWKQDGMTAEEAPMPNAWPLWTRPWSPVAVATAAIRQREARTRGPSAVAVDGLLNLMSPPRVHRANQDWQRPLLVIEEVVDLYLVELEWMPEGRYRVLAIEPRIWKATP